MQKQKAASHPSDKRQSAKKSYEHYSKIHHKYQHSQKSKKRYPYSGYSIKLAKPCQYCGNAIGLILIRFKDDLGYCKCGRCDAALFSLNESKPEQGLQHIGKFLDNYLPTSEVAR